MHHIVRLMQWRTVVVFLVGFVTVLRAASAMSWAIVGTSLTTAGIAAAILVSGIAAGIWHRYQTAHRPSLAQRRSSHRGSSQRQPRQGSVALVR